MLVYKSNSQLLEVLCMEKRVKSVTDEVSMELKRAFGDKVDRIILYGSYARGG